MEDEELNALVKALHERQMSIQIHKFEKEQPVFVYGIFWKDNGIIRSGTRMNTDEFLEEDGTLIKKLINKIL